MIFSLKMSLYTYTSYTNSTSPYAPWYAQLHSYLNSMSACADEISVLATMLAGLDTIVDNLKDEIDDQIARLVPLA
jgi:hypothetical protein